MSRQVMLLNIAGLYGNGPTRFFLVDSYISEP